MRRPLLSPSWLVRHALALGLVVAFVLLGRWQWHRAESGNSLSWAYTIEWPLFAAFVVFFWWKVLHYEIHPPDDEAEIEQTEPEPADVPDEVEEEDWAPVFTEEDDPELAAYNRYLANLNKRDERQ